MKPTEILKRLGENDTVKQFINSNRWEEAGEYSKKREKTLAIFGGLSLIPAVAGVAGVIVLGPVAAPAMIAGWMVGTIGFLGTVSYTNSQTKNIEKKAQFLQEVMQKAGITPNTKLGDLTPEEKNNVIALAHESKQSLKEMRFGTVEALNNKISNLRERFFGKNENSKTNSHAM